MSHLSNASVNIKSGSSNTFSEEPLVFTKANLEKSKFPINSSMREELKINKIQHIQHSMNGG